MRFAILGLVALIVVGFVVATLVGVAIQIAFWIAGAALALVAAGWLMRKLGGLGKKRDMAILPREPDLDRLPSDLMR